MNSTDYTGKRVVVTGCSSGVGAATAKMLGALGAEVIGLSRREPTEPVAQFHEVDLASPESIEAAVRDIQAPIDALFNCAGAPPTLSSLEIVRVNFLGPRLLTEMIVPLMPSGSAIVSVSSSNAAGWRNRVDLLRGFVETDGFDEGVAWYEANVDEAGHGYPFSKEALTVWALALAGELVTRGIRSNLVSPGVVQTPLLEAAQQAFPPEMLAGSLRPSGRPSTVDEQAAPLLFLNSSAASYVNGADLAVDGGYSALFATSGS
ncbi:coniferyl-alcohol dehydrogenase [Marisediminicola sp. LYQ134]|uniref:coniferyl-alcohol dehydrogenase n=1 Tax=unclassified Marisediminicola TaxID=2618316 RepID=UPI003982F05A